LKTAPIQRDGLVVRLPLSYRGSRIDSLFGYSSFPLLTITALGRNAAATFNTVAAAVGQGPQKSPEEEHLRQLVAALDRYHETKGSYPPPAICDAAGRPLLSWRVALLPYLNEQALYGEFKLDEPWDSLHNKQLIKKMPKALQAPNTWQSHGKTQALILTGPNAPFEGAKGFRKDQIAKEAALLVLAHSDQSVYWTKPADLACEAGKPQSLFPPNDPSRPWLFMGNEKRHMILADGTIRTIERSADDKILRALAQRDPTAKPAAPQPRADTAPLADELSAIWEAFTYSDEAGAAQTFRGIRALIRSPDKTAPFLKQRLQPIALPDPKQLEQALADLDSQAFAAREQAMKNLETLGVMVLPALNRKLAEGKFSLESRKRLERLVQRLDAAPLSADELRAVRAVEVLRGIGSPESRAVLTALAQGAEGAPQTTAARSALPAR
jgi:hypothetical protein